MLGYRSLYITWQQCIVPIKFKFLIWDRRFQVCLFSAIVALITTNLHNKLTIYKHLLLIINYLQLMNNNIYSSEIPANLF